MCLHVFPSSSAEIEKRNERVVILFMLRTALFAILTRKAYSECRIHMLRKNNSK